MGGFDDVRMRGFRSRTDYPVAVERLRALLAPLPGEELPTAAAAGRVTTEEVRSRVAVPAFDRAAMDGYAVRAEDTFGADLYNPLVLRVIGSALPGRAWAGEVGVGQCVRIMTGSPMPAGADAVLPAEVADPTGDDVLARDAVTPGRHVGRVGEDVQPGQILLPPARRLRPQDVGLLASVGEKSIRVVRRPRVAILITGDEILPPGSEPDGDRIIDSNSVMLAALASRDSGEVLPVTYLADQEGPIRSALTTTEADLILVSGGTSVGREDHVPRIVSECGQLLVHGITLRPASPTGFGTLSGRPVFLLPGNPVSCLCAYDLLAGRAVRTLGGLGFDLPHRTAVMPLAGKIASAVGRTDYVRVRCAGGFVEPIGTGGAGNLSNAVRADGFVLVDADREGHPPGDSVVVRLYE